MTYTEFEIIINDAVATEFSVNGDPTLVSEYLADEVGSDPSINISIGITGSDPGCLGYVGVVNKNYDISAGTVNLTFKLPSDYGLTKTLSLIQRAIELFNRKILGSGYIKFSPCYKVTGGVNEGSIYNTVICPFTIETIQ